MADVSELFIAPVIIAILIMFIYALFALGAFSSQTLIRRKNVIPYFKQTKQHDTEQVPGYEIHNYFVENKNASEDELEVVALKKLETLRIVTRLSPMLGLIATMIPMGPALKSLADGNIQGISENLIIAFAAVIWGLVVSTLTFWPATVKKRWYADELINIRKIKEHQSKTTETETTPKLEGAA
ncbi:MotA/TolQ/ExbB proton channel family protein [Psychrosphaera sp. F3M07]|nr:MotA/TolQ/ExbB proton channel family protein [Psychrosphaera sp. F3M07]